LEYLLAVLLSFVISVVLAPFVIKATKKLKFGQNILSYVESHMSKQGTPTMGGSIFIFSSIFATLFLIKGSFSICLMAIAVFFAFGVLGFLDDFIKIKCKRNLGLRAYQKVIGQLSISIIVAIFVYNNAFVGSKIYLPFSNFEFDLGVWIIPFVIFIFIATTNSVNLTDGLDGLAGSTTLSYLLGIAAITLIGIQDLDSVAMIEQKNLLIFAFAIVGGLIGFLIFNSHPASIFMGDTGSLALGSVVATVSTFTRQELLIPIMGIMFVVSTLSVIIQVPYYKKTKKRVFLMAPFHHHLEKKGMYESKIVTIYIIITTMLSVASLLFTIVCRG
jgi:phospho-N-acetylmuramoyl-pentapeptide-transferase